MKCQKEFAFVIAFFCARKSKLRGSLSAHQSAYFRSPTHQTCSFKTVKPPSIRNVGSRVNRSGRLQAADRILKGIYPLLSLLLWKGKACSKSAALASQSGMQFCYSSVLPSYYPTNTNSTAYRSKLCVIMMPFALCICLELCFEKKYIL